MKNLKHKVKYYIPYIGNLAIFLFWRVFIFQSTREATDINWLMQSYYSNPLWVIKIPLKIIYGFISTTILAYFVPMIIRISQLPKEDWTIAIFLGSTSALLLYLYLKWINKFQLNKNNLEEKKFGLNLLLAGIASLLITLTTIILSGRYVSVLLRNDNFDRYTISSILGVGFIIVGFLFYKISNKVRYCIIVLLIALSVTTHLLNGYWYKTSWDNQKEIWWQLFWRTPSIPKDTMLIFDDPKITNNTSRSEEYLIWAPGNLFFNYNNPPIKHFIGWYLQNKGLVENLKNKTARFSEDFNEETRINNPILISLPNNNSCLWVIDRDRKELPNQSSKLLKDNIIYSDISKLTSNHPPATPPAQIFGQEPPHNWCYYFEKASLARQIGDWDKLSQLTKEVSERNLKPQDPSEWLPFIEGLIVFKNYSQTETLINRAMAEKDTIFTANFCLMINRLEAVEFERYCSE